MHRLRDRRRAGSRVGQHLGRNHSHLKRAIANATARSENALCFAAHLKEPKTGRMPLPSWKEDRPRLAAEPVLLNPGSGGTR